MVWSPWSNFFNQFLNRRNFWALFKAVWGRRSSPETNIWVRCFYIIKEWFNIERKTCAQTLFMDFFRLLTSQSIFSPQVKLGRLLRFSSLLLLSAYRSIYCVLSNQFNYLELLISLCFNLLFCFHSQCLPTWPMSGFPLQKYTHFTTAQSHTDVYVIVQKELWRDLCKSLL